jgi:CRP/FNR family transcriptional regulator, putaive post-exponential-phase nitrogen-starvation regulator
MRVMNSEATIQGYVSKFEMARFLNEDLLRHLELFHFSAYSNVYIEEDVQHYFFFLVEGQVQCNHYHLNGILAVIALSDPFAAIGDLEILSKERVYSNVIATRDTVMLGIARPFVERYGANDPRFLRFLIEQLRDKLYKSDAMKINQLLPVIKRVAIYLLSQKAENGFLMLPDKEGLASLMGATPRHLNRTLKQLVDSGMITADYPLVKILDRQALINLSC